MKRDMELVRRILADVQSAEPGTVIQSFNYADYDARTIAEHVIMMDAFGLLEGHPVKGTRPFFAITRLTWAGHEFIDLAKNDTVWQRMKARAEQEAVTLTFDVIKAILAVGTAEALRRLGIDPG